MCRLFEVGQTNVMMWTGLDWGVGYVYILVERRWDLDWIGGFLLNPQANCLDTKEDENGRIQ